MPNHPPREFRDPTTGKLTGFDVQQALASALDGMIADNSYKALLDRWQLSDNGVEKATINAGQ